MSKTELVDEHVSAQQCKLAVDALLQHEVKRQEKKQQTELLPGKEQNVWLVVTVKQMHPEKKLKPHRMCVVIDVYVLSEVNKPTAQSNTPWLTHALPRYV